MGLTCLGEVGVCDRVTSVEMGDDRCLVDDVLDGDWRIANGVASHPVNRHVFVPDFRKVVLDDVLSTFGVRRIYRELAVETASPQQSCVERLDDVSRAHRHDIGADCGTLEDAQSPEQTITPPIGEARWVHFHEQLVEGTAPAHHPAHHAATTHHS